MEGRLSRREALGVAGVAVAGVALAPYLRAPLAPAQGAGAFSLPLRQMRVIKKPHVTLPIVQADVPVLRGERTLMWTFNGTFPGPTIRRPAGSTTRVSFLHRIPAAGTLTIHNHGHHSAAVHDGQPVGEEIHPGSGRTYVYEHREEGEPLRGSMRWYHDHSHGRTNKNSWMGLLGLFIVDDPTEAELGLPSGARELLLVLTSRTFDEDNQLVDPFLAAPDPGADAVGTGATLLVNGTPRPFAVVEPTTYRLRVLNAASFAPYNVGFGDEGPAITQIGNESGLFPAPAERERILMGPAERCDLFVDFSGFAGRRVVLDSAPQAATAPLGSLLAPATAPDEQIMEFRVRSRRKKRTPGPKALPSRLRSLPAWTRTLSTQPDRVFVFGQGSPEGGANVWTINGSPYDHERIAARPELGSTETWLLVNLTTQSHYIHLHAVDWKVISRNGGKPAADEDLLKETFRLDPGETLAVGAKFTDHTGRYLIHCHMLSHEDHAMMTTFEIVAAGAGDRTARRSGESATAVVRGRRVAVPLDTLTAEEAVRTRRLLRDQALRPGAPAAPPAEPLRLAAADLPLLCRIPQPGAPA